MNVIWELISGFVWHAVILDVEEKIGTGLEEIITLLIIIKLIIIQ
jgi:hypothetical protein